jgi:hypothetical protein
MKKLVIALSLLPFIAFAGSNHHNTYNDSDATQGQLQGQLQGQIGINKLNSSNSSNSSSNSNSNSSAGAISGSVSRASGGDAYAKGGKSVAGSYSKTGDSNAQQSAVNSINIIKKEARNNVRTAYAPVTISTSDCLGSVSAGGQGQFAGFSLGLSKQSRPCNIREYSKMFMAIGDYEAANAILCQDKLVSKALDSIGKSCPKKEKQAKANVCDYPTEECKRSKRFN